MTNFRSRYRSKRLMRFGMIALWQYRWHFMVLTTCFAISGWIDTHKWPKKPVFYGEMSLYDKY